jgi:predicted dehydrogenase
MGEPRVLAVSAATHSELGPRGRGGSTGARKTLAGEVSPFQVEDLATAFLRLEGGATLEVETSWAVYRDPEDSLGMRIYGTEGGAELTVLGSPPEPTTTVRVFTERDGAPADREVTAGPGRGHVEVVEDFLGVVRGDPARWKDHDGSLALERARVIDACYRSAREQREVAL